MFALIVIAIAVQAVYATVVRPRADAAQAYDKAQMQNPDDVSERNVYIIVKDYEQEVCFMLAFWAFAIMGYKAGRSGAGAACCRPTCCGCRRA